MKLDNTDRSVRMECRMRIGVHPIDKFNYYAARRGAVCAALAQRLGVRSPLQ